MHKAREIAVEMYCCTHRDIHRQDTAVLDNDSAVDDVEVHLARSGEHQSLHQIMVRSWKHTHNVVSGMGAQASCKVEGRSKMVAEPNSHDATTYNLQQVSPKVPYMSV